ncbi:hypothetical protein SAMN04487996_108115 [Dyadobacter soli]|uniref:Uncharacterized protein n=1 Tax=Dyadobacter soli TaxID=659014 RepID=A0A1G7HCZ2_9BACT|nr:hypothetical protein SAMN04487996_108115 [Dyadobacter soli]
MYNTHLKSCRRLIDMLLFVVLMKLKVILFKEWIVTYKYHVTSPN